MDEDQVHVLSSKLMARLQSFRRRVDQTEVDDFNSLAKETLVHASNITFQALFEALELGPILFKADTE